MVTGYSNNQANVQFKRGDIVEFKDDGEVMKATVINQQKGSGRFYNNFNLECEVGGIGTIKVARVREL